MDSAVNIFRLCFFAAEDSEKGVGRPTIKVAELGATVSFPRTARRVMVKEKAIREQNFTVVIRCSWQRTKG